MTIKWSHFYIAWQDYVKDFVSNLQWIRGPSKMLHFELVWPTSRPHLQITPDHHGRFTHFLHIFVVCFVFILCFYNQNAKPHSHWVLFNTLSGKGHLFCWNLPWYSLRPKMIVLQLWDIKLHEVGQSYWDGRSTALVKFGLELIWNVMKLSWLVNSHVCPVQPYTRPVESTSPH
jgi:hypothetical protein